MLAIACFWCFFNKETVWQLAWHSSTCTQTWQAYIATASMKVSWPTYMTCIPQQHTTDKKLPRLTTIGFQQPLNKLSPAPGKHWNTTDCIHGHIPRCSFFQLWNLGTVATCAKYWIGMSMSKLHIGSGTPHMATRVQAHLVSHFLTTQVPALSVIL